MINQRRALINAFHQFIIQIYKDAMLVMLCIAPVLCGMVFKFGIPFIQSLIFKYFDIQDLLKPYYLLFDLLLGAITPVLYCFAAAFVILAEIDDGISKYYAVTPVGKKGYLLSRLGIPAVISVTISIIILTIFKLSSLSLPQIVIISLLSAMLGVIVALLIVSLSSNKVEGMAVSKLSGLFFLCIPVPFFISGNIQYLLLFVPSYWTAKYSIEKNILYIAIAALVSIIWIEILKHKFIKKIR